MQAHSRGREPWEANSEARRPGFSLHQKGHPDSSGTLALMSRPLTLTYSM